MAELDRKKTYKNLKKKGFVDSVNHSNDHLYLEFYHEEKLILYTRISHSGEIPNYLIGAMAKQCKLSKSEFVRFARCTMSYEAYVEKLAGSGVIG